MVPLILISMSIPPLRGHTHGMPVATKKNAQRTDHAWSINGRVKLIKTANLDCQAHQTVLTHRLQ